MQSKRCFGAITVLFSILICAKSQSIEKIHRSSCRRDVLMKATDRDKKLTGTAQNTILEIHAEKLSLCAKRCTGAEKCMTINYKRFPASLQENNCQLLDISKANQSVSLTNAAGWIHYEQVAQVGPRCRLTNCDPGYFCSEACSKLTGYECLDIDECESSPCQNGGTCSNDINKYTCTCKAGFEGTNCQTDINECASSPCQNGGTCVDGVNQYSCTCAAGYEETLCQTDTNECASSPCQNGGTCVDGVNKYTCTCPAGYGGALCQTNINECGSSPCQNGGTCVDGVNQYSCTCAAGYEGTMCQTNTNECASSPCQNGGTCVDGVNQYTCTCAAGYEGTLCQTDTNECASSPCQNGGTCVDGVNQYTCTCAAGYEGTLCQTDTNECASSPCQNGGTCVDAINQYSCTCAAGYEGTMCQTNTNECASSPCQNGGTCVDAINQYSCTCAAGYEGTMCQTDTNECASSPCQNGGTCVDGVNQYSCTCAAGYEGTLCQTNINECASSPCQNGGTCVDGVNQYSCTCAAGYEGTLCQTNINECASSPCQNGGTCFDGVNQYSCTCAAGYGGPQCQATSGASCRALYLQGHTVNGVYLLQGVSGSTFYAYCHMSDGGWTLIARFSNADTKNWMQSSGLFWYDQGVYGSTTSPSTNADMINRAFFDTAGNDIKLSRSDVSAHSFLLYAAGCFSSAATFRDKMSSYGNFRNNVRWLPTNDGCRGSCTITSYGSVSGVAGFSQYSCSGDLKPSNTLGFWCHYSTGDGAVLMIGGGGSACGRADHGVGITEANYPVFADSTPNYDFGDEANNAQATTYALNLWIR
ncbi:fibropellin-1-like isoform X2 [Rhopilema esculentum]|uniref:fibropellin-1-like isoform X2 n=1 Tax=Rhopilema esculentum TaxID=499914 RepID=UPI0031D77E3A